MTSTNSNGAGASGNHTCLPADPCEAACIIEAAMLNSLRRGGRAVKKVVYEGRTTEWETAVSHKSLVGMLAYYKGLCAASNPRHPAAQGPARTGPLTPCLGSITGR